MIIDIEDLKILRWFILLTGKNLTSTWEIMRKIYPKGKDVEHMRIKTKIKKFIRYGLIFIGNNKEYILIKDRVKYKKINYDGKSLNSICIFDDGSWSSYQVY